MKTIIGVFLLIWNSFSYAEEFNFVLTFEHLKDVATNASVSVLSRVQNTLPDDTIVYTVVFKYETLQYTLKTDGRALQFWIVTDDNLVYSLLDIDMDGSVDFGGGPRTNETYLNILFENDDAVVGLEYQPLWQKLYEETLKNVSEYRLLQQN